VTTNSDRPGRRPTEMEGGRSETAVSLLQQCSKQLFLALQENELLRSRILKLEGQSRNAHVQQSCLKQTRVSADKIDGRASEVCCCKLGNAPMTALCK
jgi:hypothetical protein